ncbi:MAG: hypothetical protein SNJ76_12630 [Fimbriimonadaceae bacterium]
MRVPCDWYIVEHSDHRYDGLAVQPKSGPHSRFMISLVVARPAFFQDLAAREARATHQPGGWREHGGSPPHWRMPPPGSAVETVDVEGVPVEIWRTDLVTEVSRTRHPEVVARAALGELVVTSWVANLRRPGRWNRVPFLTNEEAQRLTIPQADFEAAVLEVMRRFLRENPELRTASASSQGGSAGKADEREVAR